MDLPIADAQFDLVFSIGVLHHGPDPLVEPLMKSLEPSNPRPTKRLALSKVHMVQEKINDWLRSRTTNMPHERLVRMSKWGVFSVACRL